MVNFTEVNRNENLIERTTVFRETLHEDAAGSLESSVANYVNAAKRKRLLERKTNVRLGIVKF